MADPSPVPGDPDRVRLRAGRSAAVAGREVEAGYWAVTVAVRVEEAAGGRAWRGAGSWFFEVGVVRGADGGLVAVGEPALVPPPAAPSEVPRLAEGSLGLAGEADEALVATVESFLGALLAGSGEVDRYTVPGLGLVALAPAPFEGVRVDGVAVGRVGDARARVRVAAVGTTPSGAELTLGYEVVLSSRDGRWEVAGVSGAPTLAGRDTSAPEAQPPTSSPPSPPSSPPPSSTPSPPVPVPGA